MIVHSSTKSNFVTYTLTHTRKLVHYFGIYFAFYYCIKLSCLSVNDFTWTVRFVWYFFSPLSSFPFVLRWESRMRSEKKYGFVFASSQIAFLALSLCTGCICVFTLALDSWKCCFHCLCSPHKRKKMNSTRRIFFCIKHCESTERTRVKLPRHQSLLWLTRTESERRCHIHNNTFITRLNQLQAIVSTARSIIGSQLTSRTLEDSFRKSLVSFVWMNFDLKSR